MANNQEWYTPPEVINKAQECMGRIDLDPCAPEDPSHRVVPALTHFSQKENGLVRHWGRAQPLPNDGRIQTAWASPFTVFVNPPWNALAEWTLWALTEYRRGHYTEGIMLVPARTETKWFQRMSDASLCLPNHRIKYLRLEDDGMVKPKGGLEPSALFYLGKNKAKFAHVFSRDNWGRVYACIS